jgi:ferredoxin
MVTITLWPEGIDIPAQEGETILDALRRNGYTMFFGCRRGGCGVCRVKLVAGSVHHGPYAPQALSPEAAAEGMVLACRAMVDSDLVVAMGEENRLRKLAGLWPAGVRPSANG